jgi:hypothetical protein
MARRLLRNIPPLVALSFAIVAFVFSLLAITSPKWAERDNFSPDDGQIDWVKPIYTLYRSPFIICTVRKNDNGTYVRSCSHYKPFGYDKTSCELEVATQDDQATNIGDARLCQQIHYAGNFGITSTFFIGMGFLITTALIVLTAFRRAGGRTDARQETTVQEAANNSKEKTARQEVRHHHQQRSRVAGYLNLSLLVFYFIGVVAGLISQFYAILGFMQSLPNQSDFASSTGSGASTETQVHGHHGPWRQGVALSVYGTCAWGFSIAAAAVARTTWQLPQWTVL